MRYPPIIVEFHGKKQSLKAWSEDNLVPYWSALRRWHEGCRTEFELSGGLVSGEPFKMRQADLEYLRETKYARAGQPDEWEIACDLIGVPRAFINEVKEALA